MAELPDKTHTHLAARTELDSTVVGIELTLISIIQGLALGVLAAVAVQPLIAGRWQVWPYIAAGLVTILIFWSRSLIHTLSFIRWPLEFGHTFIYFGATLIEAVALSQVANPEHWFALNALYAAIVWGLYAYDLKLVRRRASHFDTAPERALLADIERDQMINIRWMMPLTVGFLMVSWWLIHVQPALMLQHDWHLLPIGLSLLFGVNYLYGGVRLLRRRHDWIVERNTSRAAS